MTPFLNRTGRYRRWALCALLLGCASCSGDEAVTELVVAIDSDIEGLNRIRLKVDYFSDERVAETTLRPDRPQLPQTVGIVHEGGALGPIELEATGFINDDVVAIRRLSRVSFIKGQTMVVRLELLQRCVAVYEECDEAGGETCVSGRCTSSTVDPASLERWNGEPGRSIVAGPDTAVGSPPPGATPPAAPPPATAGSDAPPPPSAPPPSTPGPDPETDAGTPPGPVDPPDPVSPCTDPFRALITPECHVTGADCVGTVCTLTCVTGWGDCDQVPDNGCETDVLSDASHCGECGRACPAAPFGATGCTCEDGELSLECTRFGPLRLFDNCDGKIDNGCEADLNSDEHCGQCDQQCECDMRSCVE